MALSLKFPSPGVTRHRAFVEPGLSSPFRESKVRRLSDHLTLRGEWNFYHDGSRWRGMDGQKFLQKLKRGGIGQTIDALGAKMPLERQENKRGVLVMDA